ncbi:hypothetical protein K458DRAFT_463150 [Lentithecium fluviatile CBS 122367]|uniref:Uncharacterized protein n=1 Tax=Lentithecium fluviatile CBS 122367 TaxID=1168545 RepID=A0A6G1IKQ3_9PLEO|nr:hypothetical protein K458DRAFT_463150 [Lentithecium fluviatile CBS 122367]
MEWNTKPKCALHARCVIFLPKVRISSSLEAPWKDLHATRRPCSRRTPPPPHLNTNLHPLLPPIPLLHILPILLKPSINPPHSQRTKHRTLQHIPNRNRHHALPHKHTHANPRPIKHTHWHKKEIRNTMLISHGRKTQHHNPDPVDLPRIIGSLGSEEERETDEPVAHDAARDVVSPVYVYAGGSLGGSLGLCVGGGQHIGPVEQHACVKQTPPPR